MTEYLIDCDCSERKPLPFPPSLPILGPDGQVRTVRLHTRTVRLQTGDYRLATHPTHGLVERKGSLAEVAGNFLSAKDSARANAAFDRLMQAAAYPLVFYEGTLYSSRHLPRIPNLNVGLDALLRAALTRRLPIVFLPVSTLIQRREAAAFVARYLIQTSMLPVPPVPSIPKPHEGIQSDGSVQPDQPDQSDQSGQQQSERVRNASQ